MYNTLEVASAQQDNGRRHFRN